MQKNSIYEVMGMAAGSKRISGTTRSHYIPADIYEAFLIAKQAYQDQHKTVISNSQFLVLALALGLSELKGSI